MSDSRAESRHRARDRARDCFLRAAAAMTEPPKVGNVAFALLEASLGMLALAELDVDEGARKLVEERIENEMVRRKAEEAPR